MYKMDIPVETLGREQYKATYADIWWWLGGRKLHHIAPDVSRLVPGGFGNISTHQQTHSYTGLLTINCWRQQQRGEDGQIVMRRTDVLTQISNVANSTK